MRELSQYLNEAVIEQLRDEIERGTYPQVDLEMAMRFILADGVLPASGLPIAPFLRLEEWLRSQGDRDTFTATQLKNKTGLVLERVIAGRTVRITKHGRTIAEIRGVPFRGR